MLSFIKIVIIFLGLSFATIKSNSKPQYNSFIVKFKNSNSLKLNSFQKKSHWVKNINPTLTYRRALSDNFYVLDINGLLSKNGQNQLLSKLKLNPQIESIEPNFILNISSVTPNDTLFSQQWHYFELPAGINLSNAWGLTKGSTHVVTAVLDTGHRPHIDLINNLTPGYDLVSSNIISLDGDGYDTDTTDPGDANSTQCPGQASSWHGTHVMGTIGALSNNKFGVSGVNWYSKIQPVRVMGICGAGETADIIEGIKWAAGLSITGVDDNPTPAKVINLSLAGEGTCEPAMQAAIDAAVGAGSVVVVASGNETQDLDSTAYTPAVCNNIITVAAVDRTGGAASYTNFGSSVEISAPGGDSSEDTQNGVLSTSNSGETDPVGDTYRYYQGTSMATPHVSGVASLMLSLNSKLTPTDILNHIQSSARTFDTTAATPCTIANCGSGYLDAYEALLLAKGSITFSQNEIQFEKIAPNETLLSTLTVTNSSSSVTMTFSGENTIIGDDANMFSIFSDTCKNQAISPSQACQIRITYSPTANGSHHASLRLSHDQSWQDTVIMTGESKVAIETVTENLFNNDECISESLASGSQLENKLYIARNFRDKILSKSQLGEKLIQYYYKLSPHLKKWTYKNHMAKQVLTETLELSIKILEWGAFKN